MRQGDLIRHDEPDYHIVQKHINWIFAKNAELNQLPFDWDNIRKEVGELLGIQIDKTTSICIPFYTDWGRSIAIGKNVFINMGCTFMDRGGITIEDNVLIVNIILK